MKNIISLGAGVQSSMILLAARTGFFGAIPDAAIFADTQIEPKKIYSWVDWLKIECTEIPILTVTNGSLADDGLKIHTSKKSGKTYIKGLIPAYLLQPDGKVGMLGRICTADYKVKVVVAKINELIGKQIIKDWKLKHKAAYSEYKKYLSDLKLIKQKNKLIGDKSKKLPFPEFPHNAWQEMQSDPLATTWVGISNDEADRMKPSRIPWIEHRWPLIDKNMTRQDCLDWMKNNGYPEPPRSACTFCPFHSDYEWKRLKKESPEDFNDAVEYELKLQEAQRNQVALIGIPFLHNSMKLLRDIDFSDDKQGYSQLSLFGNECEGLCGV